MLRLDSTRTCAIRLDACSNGVVMKASGRLDAWAVGDLREALDRIAATQPRLVVFDWRELQHLTSAALGHMVMFACQMRREGGVIHIDGASAEIREMLETTHLERFFEQIHPRVQGVVDSN